MRLSSRARLALTIGVMIGTALILYFVLLRPVVLSVRIHDPGPVFAGSSLLLKAELKTRYSGIRNRGEVRLEPADKDSVSWTSSDPAVATVSESGILTVLSAGTTLITVTAKGSGQSDRIVVRVSERK